MGEGGACTLRTRKMMKNPLLARRQMVRLFEGRRPAQDARRGGGGGSRPIGKGCSVDRRARATHGPECHPSATIPAHFKRVGCPSSEAWPSAHGTQAALPRIFVVVKTAVALAPSLPTRRAHPSHPSHPNAHRLWTSCTRAAPTCPRPRSRRSCRRCVGGGRTLRAVFCFFARTAGARRFPVRRRRRRLCQLPSLPGAHTHRLPVPPPSRPRCTTSRTLSRSSSSASARR